MVSWMMWNIRAKDGENSAIKNGTYMKFIHTVGTHVNKPILSFMTSNELNYVLWNITASNKSMLNLRKLSGPLKYLVLEYKLPLVNCVVFEAVTLSLTNRKLLLLLIHD